MAFNKDVIEAIGNTPLIKLNRASELTGCTILGKAEFMNPGQSVKDRAGKWMIFEAEKRGDLKPGGLVLEATAGNTGIGLAVVASEADAGIAGSCFQHEAARLEVAALLGLEDHPFAGAILHGLARIHELG